MSAFDVRVCEWLNTASLSTAKKQTILNRMSVGISNYRTLELDVSHNPPPAIPTTRSSVYRGASSTGRKTPSGKGQSGRNTARSGASRTETQRTGASVGRPTRPTNANTSTSILAQQPIDVDFSLQQRIAKALRRLQEGDEGTPSCPLFPSRYGGEYGSGDETSSRAPDRTDLGSINSQNPFVPVSEGFVSPTFKFGEEAVDFKPRAEEEASPDLIMTENEDLRRLSVLTAGGRHAISAETIDPEVARSFTAEKIPKKPEVFQTVFQTLESHHLFAHLDDDDLETVVNIMKIHNAHPGEQIIKKKQANDCFYVLVSGRAEIAESTTPGEVGTVLKKGASFGDVALLYDSASPQTIQVTAPSTLCSINRNSYKLICAKASDEKRRRYEEFLSKVGFLKSLTHKERLRLAEALKSAKFHKGDYLIRYGEDGQWFNIIIEGSVDVIGRNAQGAEVPVCSFHEGDCVGELEFINGHKTVADVVATTDVVRTAKMTRKHFEQVIGPAKEVLARQADSADVYSYYRQQRKEK